MRVFAQWLCRSRMMSLIYFKKVKLILGCWIWLCGPTQLLPQHLECSCLHATIANRHRQQLFCISSLMMKAEGLLPCDSDSITQVFIMSNRFTLKLHNTEPTGGKQTEVTTFAWHRRGNQDDSTMTYRLQAPTLHWRVGCHICVTVRSMLWRADANTPFLPLPPPFKPARPKEPIGGLSGCDRCPSKVCCFAVTSNASQNFQLAG